jgi:hypothetical protein
MRGVCSTFNLNSVYCSVEGVCNVLWTEAAMMHTVKLRLTVHAIIHVHHMYIAATRARSTHKSVTEWSMTLQVAL